MNPKTKKPTYENQAFKKRYSEDEKKGNKLNPASNVKGKNIQGQKRQSYVENQRIKLNNNSEKNIKQFQNKPSSHINQSNIKFKNLEFNPLNPANQFNQVKPPSTKKVIKQPTNQITKPKIMNVQKVSNNMQKLINNNNQKTPNFNEQQKFRAPPAKQNQLNKEKVKYVKLSCEGKSSYIISTLYCLVNNENIKEYLSNIYKVEKVDNSSKLKTYLFHKVIKHLNARKEPIYKLTNFYEQIILNHPMLKYNTPKNLVNFLIFLLEEFHEEDKKIKQIKQEFELKEEIYSNIRLFQLYLEKYENTFVYENYGWINKKKVKCLVCNKETITYSYYFTYDLNISSSINKHIIESVSRNDKNTHYLTIRKCIDYNMGDEKLYNVYCNTCEKKTNLERKNLIYSTQDNLIILLTGIEHRNIIDLMKENDVIIKVDRILEINNRKFSIISIIYYDVKYNKYFNYCYQENIWIKCTDIDIKEEKSDEFLNKASIDFVPVVIFYSLNK